MNRRNSAFNILSLILLVAGVLIGAGILALPNVAGMAGFFPSLFVLLFVSVLSVVTAFIIADEAVVEKNENFHFPSLYQKYLGSLGKWLAISANLVIFYGLVTAYLTGITSIFTDLLKLPSLRIVILIVYFAVVSYLVSKESGIIKRYNFILMVVLAVSFIFMTIIAEGNSKPHRLLYFDWKFISSLSPIFIAASFFHLIVPHICKELGGDRIKVKKVLLIAAIFGFVINIIWIQVGISSIPLNDSEHSLLNSYLTNTPVTIPMAELFNSRLFLIFSLGFSVVAITTSYIAIGVSLVGFVKDLTVNHFHRDNKFLVLLISFAPPLLVSLIYPDIFIKSLNVVGGVGLVLLFGILPSFIGLIKWKRKSLKIFALILILVFSFLMILEIAQEVGLLKIVPDLEYWHKSITD
ncbi:MAG: hypothetical protein APR63_00150 [Desulfuromonas sp. SDB]|nr:MAG: hypothetical protein APR63_00150 [Desulfuromonas sp. SDB]